MTVVIATLYQDSPIRLCNAYRIDDQQLLGSGLLWLSGALAVGWFVHVARRLQKSAPLLGGHARGRQGGGRRKLKQP